jgi:SAM-dependent methyltransferase
MRQSRRRISGLLTIVANDATLAGFFPATAMPDPDWWEVLWPNPQQVLIVLGVQPEMEAIDLCCGDGLFTAPLALLVQHVYAIDIDPAMLVLARRKLATVGAANCDLIEADAYEVAELVPKPIDYVLIANTFHGVPDKLRLARGVASTLKPGGEFAVVNWHRRPREGTTVLGQPRGPKTDIRMEPSEAAAAIAGSGLSLTHVVELPPYHYGAVFHRL